jgi:hypothetical protein
MSFVFGQHFDTGDNGTDHDPYSQTDNGNDKGILQSCQDLCIPAVIYKYFPELGHFPVKIPHCFIPLRNNIPANNIGGVLFHL